jgi:hypothetical protein
MSLKSDPHYTLSSVELADWIESQPDKWWSVYGDDELLLTVDAPSPGDELAPVLRRAGKDILVWDKTPGSKARGERIKADRLPGIAHYGALRHNMTFVMAWADSDDVWELVEDEALVAD